MDGYLRRDHILVVRQHDLKQGVSRSGPVEIEGVDQHLEGQLGVREGGKVAFTDDLEQGGERRSVIDRRPKRYRIDEHPDQGIQLGSPAACHRGADHHVVGCTETRENNRQDRVYDHELRRATAPRQGGETLPGRRVDDDRHRSDGGRGDRSAWAIDR